MSVPEVRANAKQVDQTAAKTIPASKIYSNIARYINHSCRPNAEAVISGRRVWIWSRKKIKAGEEITYDYGAEYFEGVIEPIGCQCQKCGRTRSKSTRPRQRRFRRAKSTATSPVISITRVGLMRKLSLVVAASGSGRGKRLRQAKRSPTITAPSISRV